MIYDSYISAGLKIPYGRTSGNVKCTCPECAKLGKRHIADKCVSVNLTEKVWHCFKCSWSGRLKSEMNENVKFFKPEKTYKKPERIGNPQLSENAKKWFNEVRKIPNDVLEKYRITEGKELMPPPKQVVIDGNIVENTNSSWQFRNTIQFNYFLEEELINTKFRTGDKCFKMVTGARIIPYNINSIKGKRKCVITEGELDALTLITVGYDNDDCGVISVPNGANANLEYLDDFIEEYFEDKEVIYIASDTDEKGIMLREELIRRFGREVCKIVTYGKHKDINDLFVAEGTEAVINAINNAQELRSDDLEYVDDNSDRLDILFKHGFQRGKVIGIPSVDELISFETKRVCLVTGIYASGKSEWETEMCVRLNLMYGWKTAFFSPESMPYYYHMGLIISRVVGMPFSSYDMNEEDYLEAKNYIANNYCWINPKQDFTIDSILNAARYCVKKMGVKVLVIDPYNRIQKTSKDPLVEGSEIMDKITLFAQEYDVLVFLMAHPHKMSKDDEGNREAPDLSDISGTQDFANKADYGMIVHRNYAEGNVTLKVGKVKFSHLGKVGSTKLWFNTVNKRYNDSPHQDFRNWLHDDIIGEVVNETPTQQINIEEKANNTIQAPQIQVAVEQPQQIVEQLPKPSREIPLEHQEFWYNENQLNDPTDPFSGGHIDLDNMI